MKKLTHRVGLETTEGYDMKDFYTFYQVFQVKAPTPYERWERSLKERINEKKIYH